MDNSNLGRNALRTARSLWQTHHRLRLGSVSILVGVGIGWLIRSLPASQWLLPAVGAVVMIGLGIVLTGNDLARIIGTWRTEHRDVVSESWNASGASNISPDTVVQRLPAHYEFIETRSSSQIELGGKSAVLSLPLFCGGFLAILGIATVRTDPPSFTYGQLGATGFALAVLLGSIGLHEGLHAVAGRWYGADISFTLTPLGPACLWSGTVLTRRALIVITAAPLVIITLLAILWGLFDSGVLFFAGSILLAFHTPVAGGDLAQIGRRLYHPPGTKFYIANETGALWVYHPTDHERRSLLKRIDAILERLAAPLLLP
jgi:hypothetical protein